MNRTRIATGFLSVLLGLGLLLALTFTQAQGQPVFRIGILDDEQAQISRGALLAAQAINSSGGVQGADGTFFRLELIVQPVTGDNLTVAVNNLNQASVIAVLGPLSDAAVQNGLATLQTLNVPVFTFATGDTLLTSDVSGRIFRARAADVFQGRALASYLINDLGLQTIATVQLELDIDTTAQIVGFSTAAASLGITPQTALQIQDESNIASAVAQLTQVNPEIVVAYGDPNRAGQLYSGLRANGWNGLFAYKDAEEPAFRSVVPPAQLPNVIYTTTWAYSSPDQVSAAFRDLYVVTFGEAPNPISAAAYDALQLVAAAIGLPGDLLTNLSQIDNVSGVQGRLSPAEFGPSEISNSVAVAQIGPFGAPEVIARFEGIEQVSITEPVGPFPTDTPVPTATPQGVVATITRALQNVRSGPSTAYAVIGQLREGEQVQVIGANLDFSWLVIQFRGQQGWVSRSILDVFGDLNSLPIITPPPTPTPPPSPTANPIPDIVIDAAAIAPSPIIPNQAFTLTVTVRNAGAGPAGQFAIAATLPPNNVYASVVLPGLAAGQSSTVNLTPTGTFANTGFYSVTLVADLNNQVVEGAGENNNFFNLSYTINKPVLRQGQITLNAGDSLDLEGGAAPDVTWNAGATALDVVGAARIGIIPNVNLSTIHWDLINTTTVNQTSVQRTAMNAGFIIGVLTAEGNRGVLRIDDIPGTQIILTYVLYQS